MKQPYVHDLTCVLRAPVQVWSRPDGRSDGSGVQGIYFADDRVVSALSLRVADHTVDPIGVRAAGPDATFHALVRTTGEGLDPVVSLTRHRRVDAAGVGETIRLTSVSALEHRLRVTLELTPDNTPMDLIRIGKDAEGPAVEVAADASWRWRGDHTSARLASDGEMEVGGDVTVHWDVTLPPGGSRALTWRLDLAADDVPFVVPDDTTLTRPEASRADLGRLLDASRADLESLLLADRRTPDKPFVAAGAPWYFTLFGRDSLQSASMMADTNPALALGTLATLAARQGTRVDVAKAEEPGKILHEVRRVTLDTQLDSAVLPPEYYGTIDATLLWVMLLDQVERAGADVTPFLDALVAALGWLEHHADSDGDGFLEYFDTSGHGLSNQGWKDSADSIRFADGTLAEGPIVLIEVQGYAYAAARAGARILAAHGRDAAERASASQWSRYADDMSARIRGRFWVADDDGPYLAIALDAQKTPVTGVASNMGHLLGTGVLTRDEEAIVVQRLLAPDMFSGYGIRTMSTKNAAYWPWRYHVGSVWTHDTAWIIRGMRRAGFVDEARAVADGLLRALEGFDDRAPELFAGVPESDTWPPLPYPASCRPQAWAAASAYVLAEVLG